MQRYGIGLITMALVVALGIPGAVGAASPDVTLKDIHGESHHFSKYIGRGKWVVLVVWGPRCPPCIEEMPALQSFHDAYKDKAMVLGVAVDFPTFGPAKRDEVAKFMGDYLISFPNLLGDAQIYTRFGGADLLGVPTTLVYDRKGAIAARHTGSVTIDMLERFIQKWDQEDRK